MNRLSVLTLGLLALSSCTSVVDAREQGAQRWCRFEDRCGNVGSGRQYASMADCLTATRADFLRLLPTDKCDGRINAQALGVCLTAIDNTQCDNFFDEAATYLKCGDDDICTSGAPAGCNCGQGQTCCNDACVNLQTDRNNCGTCGSTCGAGASCQSGSCR